MTDPVVDEEPGRRAGGGIELWASGLVDLSGRNALLSFKETRATALYLAGVDPEERDRLLAGETVRLSRLFEDVADRRDAARRVAVIARRARAVEEEQGIATCHLALGFVSWDPAGGSGSSGEPLAPVLLQPLEIRTPSGRPDDAVLTVVGARVLNPVLCYALEKEYGIGVPPEAMSVEGQAAGADGTAEEHLKTVMTALDEVMGWLPSRAWHRHLAVGLFNRTGVPTARDLQAAGPLAEHDVLLALAGDAEAGRKLARTRDAAPARSWAASPPREEFVVLDADASQQQAIDAALAGRDLLIDGPPGTGKSQTIANLIACLAARGRRVLFVANKRAAIDTVVGRLSDVGLGDLVLDVRDGPEPGGDAAEQVAAAVESPHEVAAPDAGGLHGELALRRKQLDEYVRELHVRREPSGLSIFEIHERLARLPPKLAHEIRIPAGVLRPLAGDDLARLADDLAAYVARDGLTIAGSASPWLGARVADDAEASAAAELVTDLLQRKLPAARSELAALIIATSLPEPTSIAGWRDPLDVLSQIRDILTRHTPAVFVAPLADLIAATASAHWRAEHRRPIDRLQRQKLVRAARALRRDGVRDPAVLHADLQRAQRLGERWRALRGQSSRPQVPQNLPTAIAAYQALTEGITQLDAIIPVEAETEAALETRLRELDADRPTLLTIPLVNRVSARFAELGLTPLLELLAQRHAGPEEARAAFEWAWLSSLREEFVQTVRCYGRFHGLVQARIVAEFRRADRDHLATTARRVEQAVAARLDEAVRAHPEQTAAVRAQADGSRERVPLRALVDDAADVMLAARPCWATSPLIVSQVLPPRRLFDVVVFDEASQIPPEEAVTSIMRGRQVVFAGDRGQLPPSDFLRRFLSGQDGDEPDAGTVAPAPDQLSVLDVLRPHLTTHRLRWHYRSRDERLIAFSNEHVYDRSLATFPSVHADSPLSFVHVSSAPAPGSVPVGREASVSAEVDEVVRLVAAHAREHPDESLGVITLDDRHAARIEARLRRARTARPELAEFLRDHGAPRHRPFSVGPFFVKNIERVQGDERDAVILVIGHGRAATDHLRLGPLNREGGERRLNVAVTRARRRLTVVSALTSADLDARRLDAKGVRLLRAYLDFAESGGILPYNPSRPDGQGRAAAFEQGVGRALRDAGLDVLPQYGSSGHRVDFAVAHPDQPGRMVLAVETDGRAYRSLPSARERDRIRQDRLEDLGWRFHRIWSTDWIRDRAGEIERVLAAYKEAVADNSPGRV